MKNQEQTVSDIGEFPLIDRLNTILPIKSIPDVMIGIGDDTAAIQIDKDRVLLATCDIQLENRHFRLKNISPYQLGKRAMAVNLSDIAAMGGKPAFALVSLGLPKSFPVSSYDQLFEGMRDQLSQFSAHIIGGNLSETAGELVLDITLLGETNPEILLTRSGASVGDCIYVSGNLGNSTAGYYVLEAFYKEYPDEYNNFIAAHLTPEPRVGLGRAIALSKYATAMIDISDGLAGDLSHICEMSNVGAEIYKNKLPLSNRLPEIETISGMNAILMALHGGEDYELLFAAKPEIPDKLVKKLADEFSVPLTEIGTILPPGEGIQVVDDKNNRVEIEPLGWDHFKKKK